MNQSIPERRHLQLEAVVRGEVARQCFYYWVAYLGAIVGFIAAWIGIVEQPGSANDFWARLNTLALPALVGSALLLPLLFIHCVRLSNRFSGPLYRIRKTLSALSRGETEEQLQLRKDDYWQELAGDIERISRYIEQLQRELDEANAASSDYQNFVRPRQAKPYAAHGKSGKPLAHTS